MRRYAALCTLYTQLQENVGRADALFIELRGQDGVSGVQVADFLRAVNAQLLHALPDFFISRVDWYRL